MTLNEQKHILIQDLLGKVAREDWHGVSDAANDIRVLEAIMKERGEKGGASV